MTDVRNGEFRFDIKRSCAQLYEEVIGKYEAIGRDLTDYSFLLDLPISSLSQESFQDLQEARDKVKHGIGEVEIGRCLQKRTQKAQRSNGDFDEF